MHECTAGFGVVLAIHGPWYCLEVHMAVDEPGQHGRALRIENPHIRRQRIAE